MSLKPPVAPNVPLGDSEAWENAVDHGARGDGVTNDTAAILAAITAAGTGGTVFFPPGTFLCDTITVTASVHLRGASRHKSKLVNRETDGGHFLYLRASDITVSDLYVDGKRSSQLSATGSAIQVAGPGEVTPAVVNNVTIRDCIVYGCGFNGIGVWRLDGGSITGCSVFDCFDSAIGITEGTRNLTVSDNYVKTTARYQIGIDTFATATYGECRNVTVVGNHVVPQSGADVRYGIHSQTSFAITISGNTVDCANGGAMIAGIRLDDGCKQATVVGNTVVGNASVTGAGISVDAVDAATKEIAIVGNVVRDFEGTTTRRGIYVLYAERVVITGNVISDCGRGIDAEVDGTHSITALAVAGNHVTACDIGVRMGGAAGTGTVILSGNLVTGNASFNYAFDPVWTVQTEAARSSVYNGGATFQPGWALTGTVTWDPGSVADDAMTSTTVTVTGAVVGDPVMVGFGVAVPAGALLVGQVTAANTVTVTLHNNTGGALDLASGTLRADVWRR